MGEINPVHSGADLELGLKAVDGCRHTSGDCISQSCCESKRPPRGEAGRLLGELDGHRTTLTHIKNLQADDHNFPPCANATSRL